MRTQRPAERGQMLVLFTLSLVVILLAAGLVIDGGYAWSQRRSAQNAADLAAMAGARIVGQNLCVVADNCPAGFVTRTGQDVMNAVDKVTADNGGQEIQYGAAANGPRYVDITGVPLSGSSGWVSSAAVPGGAYGVAVGASKQWRPFFLGVIGIGDWSAGASATARSGWTSGPGGGTLLPIAVDWDPTWQLCAEGTPASSCPSTPLAPLDNTNRPENVAPGQFGWMRWPGLAANATDLEKMLTYPAPPAGYGPPAYSVPQNSYVTIDGNTGASNSSGVRTQIQNWVDSGATVLVPIISPGIGNYPGTTIPFPPTVVGTGAHAQYNVIGFAGFQLTGCTNPCIDHLQGVFRQTFFLGPTIGTAPSEGSSLALQLVR